MNLTTDEVGHGWAAAFVWSVQHLRPGHPLEHFACQVLGHHAVEHVGRAAGDGRGLS